MEGRGELMNGEMKSVVGLLGGAWMKNCCWVVDWGFGSIHVAVERRCNERDGVVEWYCQGMLCVVE